tara:strand:+ start:413506 stop:414480 length:975 start_codon:yes stop_codon:yes gene_type:complete
MKILILGAGSVGKRHARNLKELGADVSVFDPREDRRKECEDFTEYQFDDLVSVFDINWDGAVIASPPHVHCEQLQMLAERNIPTLLEKPICPTRDAALETYRKIGGFSKKVILGYSYRWWAPFLFFKESLSEVGDILRVECSMAAHLEDWHPWESYKDFFMAHKEQGGGALLDESHVIDLMLWLFGAPRKLFGCVSKVSDLDITTDDNVDTIWYYDDKIVQIHLDLHRRPHERSIKAYGTNGQLTWSFDEVRMDPKDGPGRSHKFEIERNEMFMHTAREFLDFIRNGSPLRCSLADGIWALDMVEAIRESSQKEEVVKCSLSRL